MDVHATADIEQQTANEHPLLLYRIGAILCFAAGAILMLIGIRLTQDFTPYTAMDHYQHLNALPIVQPGYQNPPSHDKRAVVTTLYSDAYAIAVAVLGHSTRSAGVSSRLILPYLEEKVSPQALCIARAVGWEPMTVPRISPPHGGKNIYFRFIDQYTKLNVWRLDKLGIESAVYLDADMLVRRNFEELFDSPFTFAAVPDVFLPGNPKGFTISFNAGMLVLRPSTEVFNLMASELETAEFPLGDAEQSFLNLFFGSKALRLPYSYNANLAIKTRSPAMWDGLKKDMRIIHYTLNKPFIEDFESPQLLSETELRTVLAKAARRDGGLFTEEVGWWREAYDRMMGEVGDRINACYDTRTSST
ncbi:glycosyltransferase family 8 protein [Infundibulicybe gibba]|nr:glycosyltransferase family 8 protein [Infundibulicybe gibba]